MAVGDIKPAEGMIAIQLFDEYDDDDEEGPPSSHRGAELAERDPDRVIMGLCVGIGPGVKSCKPGDTVCLKPWAKHGYEVGGKVRITDACNVVGTVSPR